MRRSTNRDTMSCSYGNDRPRGSRARSDPLGAGLTPILASYGPDSRTRSHPVRADRKSQCHANLGLDPSSHLVRDWVHDAPRWPGPQFTDRRPPGLRHEHHRPPIEPSTRSAARARFHRVWLDGRFPRPPFSRAEPVRVHGGSSRSVQRPRRSVPAMSPRREGPPRPDIDSRCCADGDTRFARLRIRSPITIIKLCWPY